MEQQFGAVPGVESVGLALYSTLEGDNWGESVRVEGKPEPGPNEHTGSSWDRVNASFFRTVGQPVIRGRGFTDADTANSQLVAVVNQAFVKKFFPNEDPIGRHFGVYDHEYAGAFEIVGIVANAKYNNPRDDFRPMYFSAAEPGAASHRGECGNGGGPVALYQLCYVAFQAAATNADAMVRQTLADIDPNLTVIDLHALDYQVANNLPRSG